MIDQAAKEFNLCFFDFITIELLGSIYLYCFNFMLFKFMGENFLLRLINNKKD